jgi:hypothetical protein
MKSAEARYIAFAWASQAVIIDSAGDDQVRSTLMSFASAALINAAVCRASRTAHRHSTRYALPIHGISAEDSDNAVPQFGSCDLRMLCTADPDELTYIAKGFMQHLATRHTLDKMFLSSDEVMLDIKLSLIQETLGRCVCLLVLIILCSVIQLILRTTRIVLGIPVRLRAPRELCNMFRSIGIRLMARLVL